MGWGCYPAPVPNNAVKRPIKNAKIPINVPKKAITFNLLFSPFAPKYTDAIASNIPNIIKGGTLIPGEEQIITI